MPRGWWPPARPSSSSTGKPADLRKGSDLPKPTVAGLWGLTSHLREAPREGVRGLVVRAVMG